MVDVHLSHPIAPVDMRINQPGNQEPACQGQDGGSSRDIGAAPGNGRDFISFNDHDGISERRIPQAVNNGGTSENDHIRCLAGAGSRLKGTDQQTNELKKRNIGFPKHLHDRSSHG